MDEIPFGRYRLVSLIGQGGMGKVYRAHDTEIGRDVAIKVLPTELGAQPGYRERFRREAHTVARLNEPHIIPIYDTGEIDDQLYLVMPVVDALDVQSLLRHEGALEPRRAVHIVEQLATALDAAHNAGLVHRDVKPSNALLTKKDFTYLIDFGIAHDSAGTKLTQTGMIVGSWAYMAPERFGTGRADSRSDVYALACVLYECLTGTQPYPGDSLEQQVAGHLTRQPPAPSSLNPAVPGGFGEVIAAGMAKDPGQRFQSASELATAAHDALSSNPTRPVYVPPSPVWQQHVPPTQVAQPVRTSPPPFPPTPARKSGPPRAVLVGAIVATVVVLAAAVTIYQLSQPNSPASPTHSAEPGSHSAPPSQAGTMTKVMLYQQFQSASAVGPNGQPINATLAGRSYPTSTGMWIGCSGSPATTTYRLNGKFSGFSAVAGLQPHTPDGLSARITISGDGNVLQSFSVDKTGTVPINVKVNGFNSLVISGIRSTGTCGSSSTPYGALGNAELTELNS